jgi:PAS domain S-box-containing protein
MNNRISTWNKTAESITGYKNIEVINRSVSKLDVFDDPSMIIDFIKIVCKHQKKDFENIILKTKDNTKKIIRVTGTIISDGSQECLGALFVGRDITRDIELHGKLLDGCGYLITSREIKSSIDLFVNLILNNHKGLFITRATPAVILNSVPKLSDLNIILLTQAKIKEFQTISNLEMLKIEVKNFVKNNKNAMVLIDGVHYLLTRFSFEEFISILYEINDIISEFKSILFLRVDPTIIATQKLALFENELQPLPSQKIEGLIIEDETYSILKYIFEQNQISSKVSFKKVMKEFNIAYVTAAKKLEVLEDKGLILTKREGKLRTIYITEKGKNLLHKRQKA